MRKFNKKSAITFIAALFMFAIGTPHNGLAGDVSCSSLGGVQQVWYESVSCASGASSAGSYGSNCATRRDFCYGEVYQGQPTGINVYSLSECATCKSGYRLKEITEIDNLGAAGSCHVTYNTCEEIPPAPACEGLPCEGYTKSNPKDDTSNPGRQIYCDISTDKCMYRCESGYYDSSYVFHESPSEAQPTCKECPSDHALCSNNKISCNIGYYLSRTGGLSGGVIMGNYTYSCNQCPAVSNNVGDTIYGTTSARIYNDNEVFDDAKVKTSVTLCYIPPDVHITTKEGHEYRFKSNCNYTPGSGAVIVPGN